MRRVLRSLLVVCVLGGIASADPGDPMPAEQGQKADSKFEVVKKDPPAEGAKPAQKSSKHKAKHKARKHKKAHRKAAKKAAAK